MLKAKRTSCERLKVVAQHDLRLKIGNTEAIHKLYVIQDSPRTILIGDDIMAKHLFLMAYPGQMGVAKSGMDPYKDRHCSGSGPNRGSYMVGEVAERVVIPPRSVKWVSVVALSADEGKMVSIIPNEKFKNRADLLIANSIDNVVDGIVPAWVRNMTAMDVEIDCFENLVEVAECDIGIRQRRRGRRRRGVF